MIQYHTIKYHSILFQLTLYHMLQFCDGLYNNMILCESYNTILYHLFHIMILYFVMKYKNV